MKKITSILVVIFLFLFTLPLFSNAVVYSAGPDPCKVGGADSNSKVCTASVQDLTGGIIKNVINVLLYFAGIIAVIMIIIGGLRYITSDGDSNKANQGKNTIIYALVGLVVAVSAYSIVNFVIGRI